MRNIIKNTKLAALSLGLGILMLSCEVRETIVFEKDGSGVVTTGFFGQQMGEMLETFVDDASSEFGVIKIQDLIDRDSEDFENLSEEEKKGLYALASSEISIKNLDGDLVIGMDMPFQNVNEINTLIKQGRQVLNKELNKGQEEEHEGDEEEYEEVDSNNSEIDFADLIDLEFRWDKREFERITIINDTLKYAELLQDLKGEASIGGGMLTYVLQYTFPRKIVSVVPETAVLSKDRKTVTIQHSSTEVVKNPKILDLKIKF